MTVEAASPALIEKIRTAVTDGTGQYQIVDLRPGTYTGHSFTLSGFPMPARERRVSGAGVITINVEMRVGAVTETLTVTGEQPVVDVQSTRRQSVIENRVDQRAARLPQLRLRPRGGADDAGGGSQFLGVAEPAASSRCTAAPPTRGACNWTA